MKLKAIGETPLISGYIDGIVELVKCVKGSRPRTSGRRTSRGSSARSGAGGLATGPPKRLSPSGGIALGSRGRGVPSTVTGFHAAIKTWFKANDIRVNWDRVNKLRGLPGREKVIADVLPGDNGLCEFLSKLPLGSLRWPSLASSQAWT